MDPINALSDEDISTLLKEAFDEFDGDKSGELGLTEFTSAWAFLGLKGSPSEIEEAFKSVDVDSSGIVSFKEFSEAIKGSVTFSTTICFDSILDLPGYKKLGVVCTTLSENGNIVQPLE